MNACVLYVVSATLEIAGVLVVVVDVWRDRTQARGYVNAPRRVRIPWPVDTWSMGAYLDDREVERGGFHGQMIERRRREQASQRMQSVALGAAEAELELRQTIADLLRGNVYRRLGGPALIVAGILVGTWANIQAV